MGGRRATVSIYGLLCASSACSHGWDDFDPRLAAAPGSSTTSGAGGGSTGSGGAAGAGAAGGTGGAGAQGAGGGGGVGGGSGARVVWSKSFGDAGLAQRGVRVATDPAGNVYVTGEFDGSLDFGGASLASAGGSDVFLAKLDANGAHVWSKRFGGTADDAVHGLTVTSAGRPMITGWFTTTIDFGDGPLTSQDEEDAFVATFDEGGDPVCSASFGGPGFQTGAALTVEEDDDVNLIGMFFGTVDVGLTMLVSGGDRDVFFGRVSSDGCVPFVAGSLPGAGGDYGWSIASIAPNDMVLGIDSNGSLDLGAGSLPNAGGDDIYLPRLGPDGSHLWGVRFGDEADQWAPHLEVGPGDTIAGAGSFDGTLDIGNGNSVDAAGNMDVYVMKLDADGGPLWVRGYGDPDIQHAEEMDVDAVGRVLVAGRARGTVDFGGGPLSSGGNWDVFVLALTPDGDHIWSLLAGDAAVQGAWGIAADPTGAVLVTGDFEGTLDLGAGPMTSAGGTDVFVAKISL